jgi:hypothetical protein
LYRFNHIITRPKSNLFCQIYHFGSLYVGWESAVSMVIYYRMAVWGSNFSGKQDIPPHPASYTMGNGSPSQGKSSWGHSVNHAPPSSTNVKERVELYFHTLSRPSWPDLGRTLPLLLASVYISNCLMMS